MPLREVELTRKERFMSFRNPVVVCELVKEVAEAGGVPVGHFNRQSRRHKKHDGSKRRLRFYSASNRYRRQHPGEEVSRPEAIVKSIQEAHRLVPAKAHRRLSKLTALAR